VRKININGDLFATVLTFLASILLRVGSSVVLTRLLHPEAYGVVTMLMAVAMVMELLTDLGVTALVVRHARGDDPAFLNTIWTLRLVRGAVNTIIAFLLAPVLANLYGLPELEGALRLYSLTFILGALESMAYVLAIRHQRVRVANYVELGCSLASTLFTIAASYVLRDFQAIVYGMLFNRCLLSLLSYKIFRQHRPRLHFEMPAAQDLFAFTRVVLPSSIFTLALTQYDKTIFLKLFDVRLLGLYGIAGGIAQSIDGLTSKVSRAVLYGRCAALFRADPATYAERYRRDNQRLFLAILFFPAMLFALAPLVVNVLYDARYQQAGAILQLLAVRCVLFAFLSPVEDMLVAAGHTYVVLVINVLRLVWIIPATLIGAYWFGFVGFITAIAFDLLLPLAYVAWLQRRNNYFSLRHWAWKFGVVLVVLVVSFAAAMGVNAVRAGDRQLLPRLSV
jgi:O-antigen/teichoic acid export membrane protein